MFRKQKLVKIHAHNEETVEEALIEAAFAGSDVDAKEETKPDASSYSAKYNVSLHSNSELYSDCTVYLKVERTISGTA